VRAFHAIFLFRSRRDVQIPRVSEQIEQEPIMRFHRLSSVTLLPIALSIAGACGGSIDNSGQNGNTDAGPNGNNGDAGAPNADATTVDPDAAPSLPFPAFTPPNPPRVVTSNGPVMASPKFVPVYFANGNASQNMAVTDFMKKVGGTNYWAAAVTEYGVGTGTSTDPVQLLAADNPNASITDDDIQAWLSAKLNANDPAFPVPDENTIYALFYPASTSIDLQGSKSCQSFGGYHNNITLDQAHKGMDVAYAVLPDCGQFGNQSGLDALTGTTSHELIEAVTDPFPQTSPAYSQVDDGHFYWETFLGGGEVGDMCAQFQSSFTKFSELPYTVQRGWSNKAAKAGHDPCVPALQGEAYFNSYPVMNDTIKFAFGPQSINVKGVKIAQGQSATVELDLFSDAPTSGPWTVNATDLAAQRGQAPQLKFAFDKTQGQNGDRINMTITVVQASTRGHETFIVSSKLNGKSHIWLGVVGQ
jgi:hypothetical protein